MRLSRLLFLHRALWSPRNPFCRECSWQPGQCWHRAHSCAASPCVGAVVSLLKLRWMFRGGSSWRTTSPHSEHAHITARSEITFCQWRLWTCSLQKHFLFGWVLPLCCSTLWTSLGYFAFCHASVLVNSACKLQDLGHAFISPGALADPPKTQSYMWPRTYHSHFCPELLSVAICFGRKEVQAAAVWPCI